MNQSKVRLSAGIIALGVVATACGGGGSLPVTLTAESSSGSEVEVRYELDGDEVVETVDSPWSTDIEVSGEFDLEFTVTNPEDDGDVRCDIDGLGSRIDARGPLGAECNASGLLTSNTSSISSESIGVPRPEEEGADPSAEVTTAMTSLLDGAFSLDLPSTYGVDLPAAWISYSEDELGAEQPMLLTLFDTLAELSHPDGVSNVLVARSIRPLAHPDLDTAADQLNELFDGAGAISVVESAGGDARRIELVDGEMLLRLDLMQVANEYFVVQTSGPAGDSAVLSDINAVADSLVFDVAHFPQLTHRLPITVSSPDDGSFGTFVGRANWDLDEDGAFVSAGGEVGARLVIESSSELTVESVAASSAERLGQSAPPRPVVLDGLDFVEIVLDDERGIRREFVGMVKGKIAVFEVFDGRDEPNAALLNAIVGSVEFFDE